MKERPDILLANRDLTESEGRVKAIIMSGIVYADGQKEDRAGTTFNETVFIEVRGATLKYVSRGGLKLGKIMTHFGVTLGRKVCMDIDSSTGKLTDCTLQNGAIKVYAADMEHEQLAWKSRNDEWVVCMERANTRYVTEADIPDKIQFSSIDTSFISLIKVLTSVRALLVDDGQIVCLIKPQFEAGREKMGKKGVVREKSIHLEVIGQTIAYTQSIGFRILNLEFSPVKGPEGSIECLPYLQDSPERYPAEAMSVNARCVVNETHGTLWDGDISQTETHLTEEDIRQPLQTRSQNR